MRVAQCVEIHREKTGDCRADAKQSDFQTNVVASLPPVQSDAEAEQLKKNIQTVGIAQSHQKTYARTKPKPRPAQSKLFARENQPANHQRQRDDIRKRKQQMENQSSRIVESETEKYRSCERPCPRITQQATARIE